MFQVVVSPITIGELSAIGDFHDRERRVRWALDVLDHWQITLWHIEDKTVRQRRTLTRELSHLEKELLKVSDFRRSPYDRLILLETRMANCDALLTVDYATILRHRKVLASLGIVVLSPSQFWEILKPWARLWL